MGTIILTMEYLELIQSVINNHFSTQPMPNQVK